MIYGAISAAKMTSDDNTLEQSDRLLKLYLHKYKCCYAKCTRSIAGRRCLIFFFCLTIKSMFNGEMYS